MANIGEIRAGIQRGIDENTRELPAYGEALSLTEETIGLAGGIEADVQDEAAKMSPGGVRQRLADDAIPRLAEASEKVGEAAGLVMAASGELDTAAGTTREVGRQTGTMHGRLGALAVNAGAIKQHIGTSQDHAMSAHAAYSLALSGTFRQESRQLVEQSMAHVVAIDGFPHGAIGRADSQIEEAQGSVSRITEDADVLAASISADREEADMITAELAGLQARIGSLLSRVSLRVDESKDLGDGLRRLAEQVDGIETLFARVQDELETNPLSAAGLIENAERVRDSY